MRALMIPLLFLLNLLNQLQAVLSLPFCLIDLLPLLLQLSKEM